MRIEDLNPDEVLASLLDGNVMVDISPAESRAIACYADCRAPNMDLDDEFLSVIDNGPVRSRTQAPGLFKGNLALTVFCRLLDDGTAKKRRIRQITGRCARICQGVCKDGFVFRLDPSQMITPTTPNPVTGYSATVVNVEWRTI